MRPGNASRFGYPEDPGERRDTPFERADLDLEARDRVAARAPAEAPHDPVVLSMFTESGIAARAARAQAERRPVRRLLRRLGLIR